MDQLSRWSGIVHAVLSKHSPQVKLGQVHQLLSACLGHRTYAALRSMDLETLNRAPQYVLFDEDAGLARATEIELRIAPMHWHAAVMALRPSGVTPFWLTTKSGMGNAAQITFEDTFDDRIHAIKRAMGFPDGQRAMSSYCHSDGDEVPDVLRFDVRGEVHGYNEEGRFGTPVTAVVEFPKIGCRMYGHGVLASVVTTGDSTLREPEDDGGGEVFGMSED